MEGGFIGSVVFEFIGVFSRWIYLTFLKKLRRQKIVSFSKVWRGKNTKEFHEEFEYGISNIFLGMVVTIIIIMILKLIIG